jgi:hypothetical protein
LLEGRDACSVSVLTIGRASHLGLGESPHDRSQARSKALAGEEAPVSETHLKTTGIRRMRPHQGRRLLAAATNVINEFREALILKKAKVAVPIRRRVS